VWSYDSILWVKMFGRFIGVYEEKEENLDIGDLRLYIWINDYL